MRTEQVIPRVARALAVHAANAGGGVHAPSRGAAAVRVAIASVPMPTLAPGTRGAAAFVERAAADGLGRRTRTETTQRFNALLAEGAAARGVQYVGVAPLVLDPATGELRDALFAHPDARDRHYDERSAWPLWLPPLRLAVAAAAREATREGTGACTHDHTVTTPQRGEAPLEDLMAHCDIVAHDLGTYRACLETTAEFQREEAWRTRKAFASRF